MKLLHLDSSILGENSVSRAVSAAIVGNLTKADPSLEVSYHDLAAEALPHLTLDVLGNPEGTPELAEFLAADVIVIGAGMYNFTIPSQLKAWFDRIMVAGKTFRYSESGPEGLCAGKKVIVVSTAGGLHAGQPTSAGHEDLIKALFAFIGITDVKFVRAQGLAYGDEPRAQAMQAAQQQIEQGLLV